MSTQDSSEMWNKMKVISNDIYFKKSNTKWDIMKQRNFSRS